MQAGGRGMQRRVLAEVLLLNAVFFGVEFLGGLYAHSLALLADAGHLLGDVGALGLALLAAWFADQAPTPKKSYGFYRAEILAGLGNGVALVAIAVFVMAEAAHRFGRPVHVRGLTMVEIASAGLLVNGYSALRLARSGRGLNVRAALVHMAGDAVGSFGTIVAGALALLYGVRRADPVAGAAIAVLVAASAWTVVREAGNVLLEATPGHISLLEVRDAMHTHPGVVSVHDLHVWTLTSGYVALSAHVVADDAQRAQTLLVPLRELLFHRFGIGHATLQVETPGHVDEPVHCVDDPRCLP